MLFQFVPLIFTLAHLFNVFFTGEGQAPAPETAPFVSIQLAVRIEIIARKFAMHFQCVPLIFTLAPLTSRTKLTLSLTLLNHNICAQTVDTRKRLSVFINGILHGGALLGLWVGQIIAVTGR